MGEKILAGLGLFICVLLLLGMVLGPARVAAAKSRLRGLWSWRQRRQLAQLQALQAIERARQPVQREGNVLRPDSFRRPPRDRQH
ncbi:MAG: hypothetical protein ACK5QH_13385 [Rubrivivax sp.]|jgi:hypothetical protein